LKGVSVSHFIDLVFWFLSKVGFFFSKGFRKWQCFSLLVRGMGLRANQVVVIGFRSRPMGFLMWTVLLRWTGQ